MEMEAEAGVDRPSWAWPAGRGGGGPGREGGPGRKAGGAQGCPRRRHGPEGVTGLSPQTVPGPGPPPGSRGGRPCCAGPGCPGGPLRASAWKEKKGWVRGGSGLQTHSQLTCGPHLASIHPRSRLRSGVPWSPPDPLLHQANPPSALPPTPAPFQDNSSNHFRISPHPRWIPEPSPPNPAQESSFLPPSQLLIKITFNLQPRLSSDSIKLSLLAPSQLFKLWHQSQHSTSSSLSSGAV